MSVIKKKALSIKDFKRAMESKGLTIHGIPLFLSPRNAYETREVEDGYQLFHYFQPFAHLHTDCRGRRRYLCHPSRRDALESEMRRN